MIIPFFRYHGQVGSKQIGGSYWEKAWRKGEVNAQNRNCELKFLLVINITFV